MFYQQKVGQGHGVQFLHLHFDGKGQNLTKFFHIFIFAKVRPVWTILTDRHTYTDTETDKH